MAFKVEKVFLDPFFSIGLLNWCTAYNVVAVLINYQSIVQPVFGLGYLVFYSEANWIKNFDRECVSAIDKWSKT